ncbi:hypothetical protein V8F33_008450 [Rhypophila sp. PSN 637]
MANLNHIAPELLILILSSTDSPRDLYSLISASAACFRTFVLNRNSVLLSVLRNALAPPVFYDLLAIAQAPTFSKDDDSNELAASAVDMVKPFLSRYFAGALEAPPARDFHNVVSMCRIYNIVSRLTDLYFSHTSRLLMAPGPDSSFPAESNKSPPPLSATERTRIQRAFFRHELYSRVFPIGRRGGRSLISPRDQYDLFLRCMNPWEVEEISSIHTHFVILAAGYFGDLEDQLVSAFVSCPGVRGSSRRSRSPPRRRAGSTLISDGQPNHSFVAPTRHSRERSLSPARSTTQQGRRGLPTEEEYVSFIDGTPDLFYLEKFEKYFKKPAFLSRLASFGLEFSLSLLDGDAELRKSLIQPVFSGTAKFLPEALRHSSRSNSNNHPEIHPTMTQHDDPSHPNPGYWLSPPVGGMVYNQIMHQLRKWNYEPLREMGCVFWDKWRLDTPEAKSNILRGQNTRFRPPTSGYWLTRKSVEERLRGITIPKSQWIKVVIQFHPEPEEDPYLSKFL